MFRFLLSTALFAIVSAATLPNGRIVGGSAANILDHPYQVSIQKNGKHFCGGSLYKEDIVVTAAHCLQWVISIEEFSVRVGSTSRKSGGQVIPFKAYKNHPSYSEVRNSNDVAVIRLVRNVTINSAVDTIELATITPKSGAIATVSGWGAKRSGALLSPVDLHKVEVKVLDYKDCRSSKYGYGRVIDRSMFCAMESSKDSCQGDSGGPLVSNNKLVGVVSWGNGCGLAEFPGVYADVAMFNSWILETADLL